MRVDDRPPIVLSRPRWILGSDFPLIALGAWLLVLLVAASESLPDSASLGRTVLQFARLPLGLLYVLYVPGYCLTAALFPERYYPHQDEGGALDGIERAGLSLGLSVAWVPVLALVLDRLPWGLRLWPIVLGELASITLFSAVAVWRRSQLPIGEAYLPQIWQPRPWWRSLPSFEKRIYLLCVGALLFAGGAAAWTFLVPSPAEFMTEFYILGPEGLAENYPRQMTVGEPDSVTVGVHSLERGAHRYRIEIWAVDPWEDRRQRLVSVSSFELAPDQTAQSEVGWTMPWAGDDQTVEFLLFIDDEPEPYRSLRLWLNVVEP